VVQKLALEDGPSTVSLLGSLSLSWSLKRNAPSVSSARAGTGTNRLARGSGCSVLVWFRALTYRVVIC
jgi:hypothetical protein